MATRAPKKTKTPSPTKKAAAGNGGNGKNAITDEQIAKRAYQLYLSRGGGHGGAMEDWLCAERELHNPS